MRMQATRTHSLAPREAPRYPQIKKVSLDVRSILGMPDDALGALYSKAAISLDIEELDALDRSMLNSAFAHAWTRSSPIVS